MLLLHPEVTRQHARSHRGPIAGTSCARHTARRRQRQPGKGSWIWRDRGGRFGALRSEPSLSGSAV